MFKKQYTLILLSILAFNFSSSIFAQDFNEIVEQINADKLENRLEADSADLIAIEPKKETLVTEDQLAQTTNQRIESGSIAKYNFDEINEKLEYIRFKKSIEDNPLLDDSQKKSLLFDLNQAYPYEGRETVTKYGYEFFSTIPTSIAAVGDLPLPNTYKVSIKDKFKIILTGSKQKIFDVTVGLDGSILIPELGSISVTGDSFETLKSKVNNLVELSYIGASAEVSIINLSAKKITIVGAVNTPGTYLVNPFTTITSALAYSGGVKEFGTLRQIKLIKPNGDIFYFDLYDLLINGDRSNDRTIEAGDTILIDSSNRFINVMGSVNRPAIYEIKEGEKLEDVVNFAMGFKNTSNKLKVSISVMENDMSSITQKEVTNLKTDLKGAISVNIFDYKSIENSGVLISGAVKEQGYYNISDFPTLGDVIKNIDFANVYPYLGVLEQYDQKELKTVSKLFNLNDPVTYQSINLLPNSKIFFLDILDRDNYKALDVKTLMKRLPYLTINPNSQDLVTDYLLTLNFKEDEYKLPIYGAFAVNSLTNFLGLDMSEIDKEFTTYISPIKNYTETSDYRDMRFVAQKYHNLSFRVPSIELINVTIEGQAVYPGLYQVTQDITLDELYKLMGGFKDYANPEGVIFTRESVRRIQLKALEKSKKDLNDTLIFSGNTDINPSIIAALSTDIDSSVLGRISGDYTPDNPDNSNFRLINGDNIFIPKKTNTLNVLGEVLNPNSFPYTNNISVKLALELAGGAKQSANVKGIYVIHANGLISKMDRNIFINNGIKLAPGDSIIVPRKLQSGGQELRGNILAITQIISDLAFSSAAIDSLRN